jgi:hypothetical protein
MKRLSVCSHIINLFFSLHAQGSCLNNHFDLKFLNGYQEVCRPNFFHVTRTWNPITVDTRSKAWSVFARSNTGIVDSNPSRGMNGSMLLFCICVVLCVDSGLETGRSPTQGVLPTVYRIKKLKKPPRSNKRTVEPKTEKRTGSKLLQKNLNTEF